MDFKCDELILGKTDADSRALTITQVATAAEEQSSVSEEINMNLTRIGDAAGTLTQQADRASQGSNSLKQQVHHLEEQLGKLRT